MEAKTLLVLAAGIGSRYGGLKQMDPIGPHGEFIPDYSVGDALAAGFGRVVFVVRPDILDDFRDIVGRRWEARTDVDYALQRLDDLPAPFALPEGRAKPWGTAHAVYAARGQLRGPFLVVNADDYYGAEAPRLAAGFLDETAGDEGAWCMVAYRLDQTLSANSTVSRGVCTVAPDGTLASVVERLALARCPDGAVRDGDDAFPDDTPVSMNLWGFKRRYVDLLEESFPRFLAEKGALPKSEFQIPTEVAGFLREGRASVRVLRTAARWYGVTSRDDRPEVAAFFATIPSPFA
jgi:hypothetical protein